MRKAVLVARSETKERRDVVVDLLFLLLQLLLWIPGATREGM